MGKFSINVREGENLRDGYTVAILAAMGFLLSQVPFQRSWFDFNTLILTHIRTLRHIKQNFCEQFSIRASFGDNNVSFFDICCRHRLQAMYASLISNIFALTFQNEHSFRRRRREKLERSSWSMKVYCMSAASCEDKPGYLQNADGG